jgi:hypothetical protein
MYAYVHSQIMTPYIYTCTHANWRQKCTLMITSKLTPYINTYALHTWKLTPKMYAYVHSHTNAIHLHLSTHAHWHHTCTASIHWYESPSTTLSSSSLSLLFHHFVVTLASFINEFSHVLASTEVNSFYSFKRTDEWNSYVREQTL